MSQRTNGLRRGSLAVACLAVMSLNNCADDPGTEISDSTQVVIDVGDSAPLSASIEGGAYVLTVDCAPPSNPDAIGALISVQTSLDDTAAPVRAGFWQWAGEIPTGDLSVVVHNAGNTPAVCGVSLARQSVPAAEPEGSGEVCSAWSIHRSRIYTAMHLALGDETNGEWEELPSSGNHWGAWAEWNTVYQAPVLRGFYLHNLEHGGAVLSYGCSGPDESEACKAAEQKLIDLAMAAGHNRVLVTPDPDQGAMFAVRTWRWAYSSDCLDETSAKAFLDAHIRNGREDVDGGPPLPFDPTTTEGVPCQNLIAAPDGC